MKKAVWTIPLLALSISACTKEESGTLIGAIAGAAVGSEIGGHGTGQNIGLIVGALAGAYVGGEVGRSLDRADRAAMQQTTQYALESQPDYQSSDWVNPNTGHKGTVTPQSTYESTEGQYCREYQQTVTIGGKTETMYGTACRQPDGSWKIVSAQ